MVRGWLLRAAPFSSCSRVPEGCRHSIQRDRKRGRGYCPRLPSSCRLRRPFLPPQSARSLPPRGRARATLQGVEQGPCGVGFPAGLASSRASHGARACCPSPIFLVSPEPPVPSLPWSATSAAAAAAAAIFRNATAGVVISSSTDPGASRFRGEAGAGRRERGSAR